MAASAVCLSLGFRASRAWRVYKAYRVFVGLVGHMGRVGLTRVLLASGSWIVGVRGFIRAEGSWGS